MSEALGSHGHGSAYVFDLNCTDCLSDLNGDGEVNTLDFGAYLNDWVAGC